MNSIRRVAILGGNRIPFARSNTAYADASNQQMLTAAVQGLIDRYNLHHLRLGEVAAGAVIKHSRDFNLTRESVLSTTLAPETPAYDLQQACGTGLEAAILVANKIALGQIDVGIAGGVDTTSDAPIGVNERMRKILLEINRSKTAGQRVAKAMRLRPDMFFKLLLPRNTEPRTGLSMGEHCELMVKEWQIGREEQDRMAVESHRKLAAAYDRGFFTDLVTPFHGLNRDNNLRPDISLEKLATLKPAFDRAEGTLTAANSTTLTDGASCVLLASEDWARERGLPVLAYLSFSEVAAVDFVNKKERSLALKKALEELLGTVRAFYARGDEPSAVALREGTARFYDRQLRHLMYRDWSAFEQFFVEILKCNSLTALKPITHRYETFLQTLLREVEKRAVLQSTAA